MDEHRLEVRVYDYDGMTVIVTSSVIAIAEAAFNKAVGYFNDTPHIVALVDGENVLRVAQRGADFVMKDGHNNNHF